MATNDKPAPGSSDSAAARIQGVEDENMRVANRTMPGRRAALPEGAIPGVPPDPQADENRDQPRAPDGSLTTPDQPPLTE